MAACVSTDTSGGLGRPTWHVISFNNSGLKRLCSFLIFLTIGLFTRATGISYRQFIFDHIGRERGLDERRVFSIREGSDGAIWIATKNGVARYNGHRIEKYDLPLAMRASDASGRMFKLRKSGQKLFAFDNTGKIFAYNPLIDEYVVFLNLQSLFQDEIILNDISIDRSGRLWVAMSSGVYRIDADNKVVSVLSGIVANTIRDTGDTHYIGTNSGVIALSNSVWGIRSHLLLSGVSVQTLFFDTVTSLLWVGTFNHGVQLVDTQKGCSVSSLPSVVSHNPVRCITPLNANTILLGIDGAGVWVADRSGGAAQLLMSADDKTGNVLHGNGIYDICADRWGDIWIGSYTGGVDVAYPMGTMMSLLEHVYMNPQSPANNDISAVMQDSKGNIWLGSDMGMSILDPKGQWHHGLTGKVVLAFCERPDGSILAGTYGAGVYEVFPDGRSRPLYNTNNQQILTNYVYSLFSDKEGNLWIGCLDGPLMMFTTSGKHQFDISLVQAITSTPDGHIAVSTANGFYLINPHTRQYTHHFPASKFPGQDINVSIQSLLFVSNNQVWLGSDGGGIYIYDIRQRHVQNISTLQGLPSNYVYALGTDGMGRVWAATDKGLVYIEPGQPTKVINVNFVTGLEREYRRQAMATLSSGSLIFGSSTGAVILNPTLIGELSYKAPLKFKRIHVVGSSDSDSTLRRNLYHMLAERNVRLSYSQNSIDIGFESINYPYQNDIVYKYCLEGGNGEWVSTGSDQTIHLTRLSSGHYRLLVRSISRNGGKVLDTQALDLHIAPPWWNSWWAWVAYIAVAGSLVYLLWRRYRSVLDRRYFNEKVSYFINTAHDIRTPLTLVLAPLDDMAADNTLSSTTRAYLDTARRNGEKLRRKISGLLDFQQADHLGTNLHVEKLNLRSLLQGQIEKFKLAAHQKGLSLALTECPTDTNVWLDPFMADSILENLISNAIKYTPSGGHVAIRATATPEDIRIEVSDTGIGIPPTARKMLFGYFYRADNARNTLQQGSGIGLMLVRRFVQLHQGTLSYTSKEGQGTTFVISFKQGNKHLNRWLGKEQDNAPSHQHPTMSMADKDNKSPMPISSEKPEDTLLFVDDNQELCDYISTAFSPYYLVVTVRSAEDALQYLENGTCDIIVSDVMMPGMQGDELCRKLKTDPQTSWLPIILLTAKAGRNFMIEGLNTGADDYIEKPFDSGILHSKIATILTNRKRLQAYYMAQSRDVVNRQSYTFLEQKSEAESVDVAQQTASPDPSDNTAQPDDAGKIFIKQATQLVLDNLQNANFDINALCRDMAMSRTLFYGKLKAYTGIAPQEFIRTIRLENAAVMLRQGATVAEAATRAGFANVKYFSTIFRKQFGIAPSQYK